MTCDLCGKQNLKQYIDGKTVAGMWANMCLLCHSVHATGLGTGKGQHYKLVNSNHPDKNGGFYLEYKKVAG